MASKRTESLPSYYVLASCLQCNAIHLVTETGQRFDVPSRYHDHVLDLLGFAALRQGLGAHPGCRHGCPAEALDQSPTPRR